MVVEDPAAGEHPVPPAVAPGDEVRVRLRDAVGRQRPRGRLLRLRRLARLAEDLARGRLVHADRGIDLSDGLEQRRRTDRRELRRPYGLVPRTRDERGRREVVDLPWADGLERSGERGVVEQVGLHELDTTRERPERLAVLLRRSADDAGHLVPLLEEEPREERPVLPADAGDQCACARHRPRQCTSTRPRGRRASRRMPRWQRR